MGFTPVVGKSIKKQLEDREEQILSYHAMLNKNSRGRLRPEKDQVSDLRLTVSKR